MARLRRIAAVLAVAVLMVAAPGAAHAERTIGLSALTFKFASAIGGTGNGTVQVYNSGDEDLTVLVYAADQLIDESGQIEYAIPSRDQIGFNSPASWFFVKMPAESKAIGNTPYLELAPGEQVPIDFSYQVPSDARSGDNTVMLFFEMAVLDSTGEGSTSKVGGRIGARITIRVEGVVREAVDIEPFHVPAIVYDSTVPYSLMVRNSGNIDKVINADIQLLARDGEVTAESRVASDTTLFAMGVHEVSGDVVPPGTVVGRRTVRAIVTYVSETSGNPVEERLVEERDVWLVPLWLAVLVGSLGGLAVLWVIWRLGVGSGRRRKRREVETDRPAATSERSTLRSRRRTRG